MPNTILVVDDEPMVRTVLRQSLERVGHRVVEAECGKRASELLGQHDFDLAIIDILMPDQDGLDLIMDLRMQKSPVKVIAITGSPNDLYLKTARLMGVSATFTKPVPLAELTSATSDLLAG